MKTKTFGKKLLSCWNIIFWILSLPTMMITLILMDVASVNDPISFLYSFVPFGILMTIDRIIEEIAK